jgi:uncharacterized membrane protein (DUF4010 family)
MVFGLLFILLAIVTSLVQQRLGNPGVLALAAVVGVTDIDPFILSLVGAAFGSAPVVVPAIIVAMMSNTVAKSVYFAVLVPSARREVFWRYAVWTIVHVPILLTP